MGLSLGKGFGLTSCLVRSLVAVDLSETLTALCGLEGSEWSTSMEVMALDILWSITMKSMTLPPEAELQVGSPG